MEEEDRPSRPEPEGPPSQEGSPPANDPSGAPPGPEGETGREGEGEKEPPRAPVPPPPDPAPLPPPTPPSPDPPPPPVQGSEGAREWEETGQARGYWAVEEPYGREGYYAPAPGSGTGRATAAMILGIAGLALTMCCCGGGMFGLVCSIVAWVLGHQEVRAIHEGRANWEGLGPARAGMIMGIIGTILNGLFMIGGALFYVFYFAVAIASGMGQ